MIRGDLAVGMAARVSVRCAMRAIAFFLVLPAAAALTVPAAGAEMPNPERGRLLYENHCLVCHTQKVHRRIPPLPIDLKELRRIVAAWAEGQKLGWSEAEITDVTEYLDTTHYRFLK